MEADFGGEDEDAEEIAASGEAVEVEVPAPAVEKTKEKKHKKEKKEKRRKEKEGSPEEESKSTAERAQKKALEAEPEEAAGAAGSAADPPRDTPDTVTLEVSPEAFVQENKPKQEAKADGVELWQVVEAVVAALGAPSEAPRECEEGGGSVAQDEGPKQVAHADGSEDPQALQGVVEAQEATAEEAEPLEGAAGASLVQAESSPELEGAATTEATAEVPSGPVGVPEGTSLVQEISKKEEEAESLPTLEGATKAEEATAEHAEVLSEPMGVLEGASLVDEISTKEEEGIINAEESSPLLANLREEDVSRSASSQEGSAEAGRQFGIPTEAALAALRGEGPPQTNGVSASSDPLVSTPGLPQLDYDCDGSRVPRPRPEVQEEPSPKRVKLEEPDVSEITGTPEEVRLLMEAAELLKDEASTGWDFPYSVEILTPAASGENPSMIELYGEALLSSHAAPVPQSSTPPWRLCREARRNDGLFPQERPSTAEHGETPYEAAPHEAAPHDLAPNTPAPSCAVPGVMLPTPSEVASHEQVQVCLSAFQILASLDLPFADKLQVAWMVDNAKCGLVNVADYYNRCLQEVVVESGLTEQHLGALGIPLSVPRFPALPNYETHWYVSAVYPSGKMKREILTFEEARASVLASELHIGSCQEPTQEGMRAVLQSMPPWYLLKSWVAARMNGAATASEDLFMGFRGKEAVKVLERNEVEPGMIKAVCASHRDYVETLLDACCITPLEWDALLERRLSLDSVKLDERWFVEKEDALVTRHGWVRSHRLLLAKAKRPDLYPGVHRELQEAKARGKELCLIPEEQAFNSWHVRPNRGRGGPYGRH